MALISVQETPVKTVDCHVSDCQKRKVGGYRTKKGLTDHIKRWHQVVKDAFSPIAVTARALFDNTDEEAQLSTQGNSAGAINSPKVVSEGSFLCGVCENAFKTKSQVDAHMTKHDKASSA